MHWLARASSTLLVALGVAGCSKADPPEPTKAQSIDDHCKAGIDAPLDVLCMVGRPVDEVLGACERKVGGTCQQWSAAWFFCKDDTADMTTMSVHARWTGADVLSAVPDGPAIGVTRNIADADPASRAKTREALDGRLRELGCKAHDSSEVTTRYRCGDHHVELFSGSLSLVSVRAGTAAWREMCEL